MILVVVTTHDNDGTVLSGLMIDFLPDDYPGDEAITTLVYDMPIADSAAIVASVSSEGKILHIVERITDHVKN